MFQCDNGCEFANSSFQRHFDKQGMTFRFSCPYTSQQNGKSERMIRTVNNTIRSLLFHSKLPPIFWVEALHVAVHLQNILPSSSINNQTSFYLLFNKRPTYDHLRSFGCLCYPNLNNATIHKLSPRSSQCIFLGYPTQHRGYRCFDLNTKRIIISRHVIFDETKFPSVDPQPPNSSSY